MAINETLDASNRSSSDQAVFRTFKLSMYSSVLMLSIAGNIILICAICKFRKLRTVPNFLVLNLSICDLLVVISSIPFQVAYEELAYFPFGRVGCKTLWPVATGGVNAGVLTLVAIAVERYKAITSPMSFRFNRYRALSTIFLTHVIGICAVVPYSLSLHYSTSQVDCLETWSRKSRQIYTLTLFLLQYAIPLPVIVTLYSLSWNKLRHQNMETIRIAQKNNHRRSERNRDGHEKLRRSKASRNGSRKSLVRRDSSMAKRLVELRESFRRPDPLCQVALQRYEQTMRTLKMFIAVIVVFAVCALPNQITWLWTDFSSNGGPGDNLSTVFYFLTYTNSVFNPWIYGGFNPSFRQAYKVMVYDKGILPLCRLLRCLPAKERNTEILFDSRTDYSGVYKFKNSQFDYSDAIKVSDVKGRSPVSSSGSFLLPTNHRPNLRNGKKESYAILRPSGNSHKTSDASESEYCVHISNEVDTDEKKCYLDVPDPLVNLHPRLIALNESNGNDFKDFKVLPKDDDRSSLASLASSGSSSVTNLGKRPRKVSFLDEKEGINSAPSTPPHSESAVFSSPSHSYEDLPPSAVFDFLSLMRETDF
uniref:Neuropeptide-like GPCR n=1 Tax=Tripedalia cystophora TaxID=6141 RepID=A0A4D5XWQ5_TRICY|nr:neuropeptide-like GPCR [Tripedalia cystophora]